MVNGAAVHDADWLELQAGHSAMNENNTKGRRLSPVSYMTAHLCVLMCRTEACRLIYALNSSQPKVTTQRQANEPMR